MNDRTTATPNELLLNFLLKEEDPDATELAMQLAAAGGEIPMHFGQSPKGERDDKVLAQSIQLEIALKSLDRVLLGLDKVLSRVRNRIKTASILRLVASIITVILSSSVVVAVTRKSPESFYAEILGIMTVAVSIMSLFAGWLEGSNSKLNTAYTKLSVLHAQALNTQDRLAAYKSDPALFSDLDKRISETVTLVTKLEESRAEFSIV